MSGLVLAAVGEDAKVHLTSQTRVIAAVLAVVGWRVRPRRR